MVQDRAPSVMKIDAKTGATEQFRVPLPQDSLQMSGPAVATAPDGGIWATLFGDDGGLVRFGPDGKRSYLKIGKCGAWLRTSRFIHMRFVALHGGTSGRRRAEPRQLAVFNVCFSSRQPPRRRGDEHDLVAFNPYGLHMVICAPWRKPALEPPLRAGIGAAGRRR